MNFRKLPEAINCTHVGVPNPVLFRFEGGDNQSGFFVEDYKETPLIVKLYGDIVNARLVFFECLKILPSLFNVALDGNFIDQVQSSIPIWYNFDMRHPSFRIDIYYGMQGISITTNGTNKSELGEYLYAVYQRIADIYKLFYNV